MEFELNDGIGNDNVFEDYLYENWNVDQGDGAPCMDEGGYNYPQDPEAEPFMDEAAENDPNDEATPSMDEDADNDQNEEHVEDSDNLEETTISSEPEECFAEDDSSLLLSIEKKLSPGSHLLSMDQAYLLYCEYGRLVGFSVKKGPQRYYTASKTVRRKKYLCSCHGTSNANERSDRLAQYKKQDFRCKCPAKLRIVRSKDGRWGVTILIKEHNHELADKENSYLLRSCRNLSHADKSRIEALHQAGIRLKDAFRFMEQEGGGTGKAGFIRKDVYHHMDNVRKEARVEHADANTLVKHFMAKTNAEPDFYWNMHTDSEGRVFNFFFRDSRSAVDFEFFGDLLSFDTTYKTNKYELICAPFVGVNHHLKNCLFGLAFLSDETTETFEWLFSCFKESMNGKEPDIVFSDQCKAMMNAFEKVFKTSSHRLCQWHINQNGPSYFGSLNYNGDFKEAWNDCMKLCETEEAFKKAWTKMIDDFNLQEVNWFRNMYALKKRWATVFTRHKFCAGLHATSRSEVTNKVLKEISSSSSTLHEFVLKYEQTQLEWRREEGQDDTLSLGVPGLLVAKNPALRQAAKFFTRSVFLSYEYEATRSINVDIIGEIMHGDHGATSYEYEIKDCDYEKKRHVTYNPISRELKCTCCLWETHGVLCSHVFKVLYHHNLKEIPAQYMLRRLSKDAKLRRPTDVLGGKEPLPNCQEQAGEKGCDKPFKTHVIRSMNELLDEIKMNLEMKELILKNHDSLRKELLEMAKKEKSTATGRRKAANTYKNATETLQCLDPKVPAKRRFTNTRLSRHWEKRPRKGKKRCPTESDFVETHNNIPIPNGQRRGQRAPARGTRLSRASSPQESPHIYGTGSEFSGDRACTSALDPLNFYATQ